MEHITSLITTQRTFFTSGITQSIAYRKNALKTLQSALYRYKKSILEALTADLKKPVFESESTELFLIHKELSCALKEIDCWTQAKKIGSSFPLFFTRSFLHPEPYGCTLIIAPWNYPFQLSLIPLIGALAAGNCAIIKPSEHAPACAMIITKIIKEIFDPGYVTSMQGGIPETQALLSHRFDYIFFTGGTRVGTQVMRYAAEHLTPITLELGGKSPCIVGNDTDLTRAASRIVWGKFTNAGQNCISPDYLFVDERIAAQFTTHILNEIKKQYGENPQKSPSYGRIINKEHVLRLGNLMKEGTIIYGGHIDIEDHYVAPTILTHVSPSSNLMREEIFGPLLPIITYRDLHEIITFINANPKPLALYCFSSNSTFINEIIKKTSSGGICINDTLLQAAHHQLPFGGIGASGMGSYHGKYSFDTFTHYKPVLKSSRWTLPFNRISSYLTNKIVRYFIK